MTKSKFKIETEILNNKPLLTIFLEYKDYFTDDSFVLKTNSENMNDLNFSIYKSNNKISELNLKDKNVNSFINETFKIINDFDFKEDFKYNHLTEFSKEIEEIINEIDSSIIIENKIVKGYKDKMKMMSGIILNKNIR